MYALVTGGSQGVGYYMARELKMRGYELILVARNEEKLKKVAKELDAKVFRALDLAKEYRAMRELIEEFKPNVVINNAGCGFYGDFASQDEEKIMKMIDLNITALTYITKKAMENMDKGYIMNVASIAACRPVPKAAVYAATKAYVKHLTASLIPEAPPGIYLSYLLLSPTATRFWDKAEWPTHNIKWIMLSPEKAAKRAIRKMFKGKKRIAVGPVSVLYCLGK